MDKKVVKRSAFSYGVLALIIIGIFIFMNALKNLKLISDLFLEKTPKGININEIKEHILKIKGVKDVHHIHLWSLDGYNNYATVHIVEDGKNKKIKELEKEELKEHNVSHTTIELEKIGETCSEEECEINVDHNNIHHHHH